MMRGGTALHGDSKHTYDAAKTWSTSWAGNDTQNRLINHAAGTKPKAVLICCENAAEVPLFWIEGMGTQYENAAGTFYTFTEPSINYIYVGAAATFNGNVSGRTYDCIIWW